jgi:Zn-dependent peptidase ImmA (M78 family)
MRIQVTLIRKKVKQLLEELGVHDPPVPVRKVARQCDARIVLVPGEEDKDLSGFLYRGSDHSIIGVNKDHVPVRQRFTIAHEIGHLLLHEHDQVHVDRGFRVRLRSDISSQGTDRDEMEANRFAAELLMPLKMLQADVQSLEFDLTDDDALWALAKRYGVSTQAMTYRLNTFGYKLI